MLFSPKVHRICSSNHVARHKDNQEEKKCHKEARPWQKKKKKIKVISFAYKNYQVVNKNALQCVQHADNYRRRRDNVRFRSAFEAAQSTVSQSLSKFAS